MPTLNPRLTVTLSPAVAVRLKRLSELSGNSQASFISDLVSGSVPVIDRLIALMEAAKQVQGELSGQLVVDMEAAQSRVEAQLGLALGDFDQVHGQLLEEVEAVKRRKGRVGMRERAGASVSAAPTPISNRGVRSRKNTPRTSP